MWSLFQPLSSSSMAALPLAPQWNLMQQLLNKIFEYSSCCWKYRVGSWCGELDSIRPEYLCHCLLCPDPTHHIQPGDKCRPKTWQTWRKWDLLSSRFWLPRHTNPRAVCLCLSVLLPVCLNRSNRQIRLFCHVNTDVYLCIYRLKNPVSVQSQQWLSKAS